MCEYKDVFKGGIVIKAPDNITYSPWRRFAFRNIKYWRNVPSEYYILH
jgi:hypothetical protein